jgi:hypothetical protein
MKHLKLLKHTSGKFDGGNDMNRRERVSEAGIAAIQLAMTSGEYWLVVAANRHGKRALAQLASSLRVPVVPIAVDASYRGFHKGVYVVIVRKVEVDEERLRVGLMKLGSISNLRYGGGDAFYLHRGSVERRCIVFFLRCVAEGDVTPTRPRRTMSDGSEL